jgi:3-phenylpropionate/trans-cinnamate dioxygenase ferredoxin reductase component
MSHYKYVIVGGGMTADAAVGGIREVDPYGSIGLFSMESDSPYNRPPLSKDLWKGTTMASIWRNTADRGTELHLACKVESIDPERKWIVACRRTSHTFDKLLLATGGTPRRLPFGADRIIYFRTLADYRRLQALAEKGQRFAVIGGGFIGSEITAALASNGKQVTMITPEQTIGSRVFPRDLGIFLNGYYRQKGVELLTEERAVDVEARGDFLAVKTRGLKSAREREIKVDGVVAGIGLQPNIDLAKAAALQVDNGIIVDEYLRTNHPDIYAAGDVAAFYNPSLRNRIRVEHEDNANTMGRMAGRNMAGEREPYHRLPSFYSDLFEFSYEAVGDLDPRLEIVTDWTMPNRMGAIYYLREGRVRGVLLWNIWGAVDTARELIAEPGPLKIEDLKKRLPLGR